MSPDKELKIRRVLSLILEGVTKWESYQKVFQCSKSSANSGVQVMLKKPEVQDMMELMAEEAQSKLTMSRTSKREFLCRLRDVKITEINLDDVEKKDHDLIESVTYRYDREGNKISATVKLPSKLQALDMDNRMAGHNEAEKIEIELTGGVMMIPAPTGADAWELEAEGQQRKLKEVDYVDIETEEEDPSLS
jgi:hypothetical protein